MFTPYTHPSWLFIGPLVTAIAAAIAPASADFHILNGTNGTTGYAAKAVPSNQYSCAGWRAAPAVDTLPDVDASVPFFHIRGLCGVQRLDFYNNGAGFDVYVHGTRGAAVSVGTCFAGSERSINGKAPCTDGYAVFDAYVCLSEVCT